MAAIPKQITIPLGDLQHTALQSLMRRAPNNYDLNDLLQLVLIKGLEALLVGEHRLDVKRQVEDGSEQTVIHRPEHGCAPRAAADFIGFPLDSDQDVELDNLLQSHVHLSEEELCQIAFESGLRMLREDPCAKAMLASNPLMSDDGGDQ